ncbi:TetR/AcrR family transcriptional regulator [Streptomyces sp. NPDC018972]|uniref:TetR/AcrR family transcriptional regulator n=1 Tax=Streptomyces sp. NPDC018972 TaxID=3365060 RepID=UPI0037A1C922
MSSSSAAPGRGDGTERPPMRDALVAAAFRLFLERGYEQTTADDVVALAGVGRRSFFRSFPSEEDVVFPDHERCLADMTAFLAAGSDDDPVRRVCDAARLVPLMYAENPAFSVQRHRLTKSVPGLRAYELSVVRRYERAPAGYLRARFAGLRDGALRADVIAAVVVAAHNNALRSWLRSDGKGDAEAAVDHALGHVRAAFGAGPVAAAGEGPEDVVVVASRRGTPLWRVVRELETALGRG